MLNNKANTILEHLFDLRIIAGTILAQAIMTDKAKLARELQNAIAVSGNFLHCRDPRLSS